VIANGDFAMADDESVSSAITPPEERQRLASTFDTLVESNLKLASSLDGLMTVVRRHTVFQSAIVLAAVAYAIWRR
jgi:hypothetical protein